MTHTRPYFYAIVFALFLAVLVLIGFMQSRPTLAAAPPGIRATIATTSNPVVAANTAVTLIATSTCVARIISTASTSLMLTFSDYKGDTPSAIFGVWQAASSTVTYDASTYGCGLVKGYSFGSGVITVIDSR